MLTYTLFAYPTCMRIIPAPHDIPVARTTRMSLKMLPTGHGLRLHSEALVSVARKSPANTPNEVTIMIPMNPAHSSQRAPKYRIEHPDVTITIPASIDIYARLPQRPLLPSITSAYQHQMAPAKRQAARCTQTHHLCTVFLA